MRTPTQARLAAGTLMCLMACSLWPGTAVGQEAGHELLPGLRPMAAHAGACVWHQDAATVVTLAALPCSAITALATHPASGRAVVTAMLPAAAGGEGRWQVLVLGAARQPVEGLFLPSPLQPPLAAQLMAGFGQDGQVVAVVGGPAGRGGRTSWRRFTWRQRRWNEQASLTSAVDQRPSDGDCGRLGWLDGWAQPASDVACRRAGTR